MSIDGLLESALRTAAMTGVIFLALYLFRVHGVRARRSAALLTLFAALAMPALQHWTPAVRFVPDLSFLHAPSSALPARANVIAHSPHSLQTPQSSSVRASTHRNGESSQKNLSTVAAAARTGTPPVFLRTIRSLRSIHSLSTIPVSSETLRAVTILYFTVAMVLLLRLSAGLALAFRLRDRAKPARFADDVRVTSELTTPVTIGTTVLLPAECYTWNIAKLNIVLAHERAHVRQADFYVQLLAGLHCALFWFSPVSWWLQQHLSSLGEAMSDLAAVNLAESRSSYAEMLLEFATSHRRPFAAVAMASTSNLRLRIDRLLSERLFQQASAGARRHPLFAAGIVPLAFVASISLVTVHAAEAPQAIPLPAPQPPAPPAAVVSLSAALTPPQITSPATPKSADGPANRKEPMRAQSGEISSTVEDPPTPPTPPAPDSADNFVMSNNDSGDSFAFVDGNSPATFAGTNVGDTDLDQIRRSISGSFIYYRHDGKSWLISDPSILDQARTAYAPMHSLSVQQEGLGKRQAELGKLQEDLARQVATVHVPPPDLSLELKSFQAATEKLKDFQIGKEVDPAHLAEVQGQVAEIQGQLAELQALAGAEQGKFGAQQGALGEKQGHLGELQGHIGEQQARIAAEAQRKIQPLIDKAIRDGRAKPLK